MDTSVILWTAGFVIAGYAFWLNDWKTKTETQITEIKNSYLSHLKDTETYRNNVLLSVHKLELELSTRMTRDELKEDFNEFKKEMRDIIRGILNQKETSHL